MRCWGYVGLRAPGCEMVLRTIGGLAKPSEGRVIFDGRSYRINPSTAAQLGIGYVSADRFNEGLVLPLNLTQNVTLPRLDLVSSHKLLNKRKGVEVTESWIGRFRVRCSGWRAKAGALSGGNQQKIVLSRWLAAEVKLLLLDHPTRGIDVGAKSEVYALIRDLSLRGMAVILVGDTMDEVIGLSHRLVCMRDGEVTGVIDGSADSKPEASYVVSLV